jgi:hypothetical protein
MKHDVEKIVRELSRITQSYHEWWHKFDDDISGHIDRAFGPDASLDVSRYRKARSAVTSALVDLAEVINETDVG